MTYQSTLLYKPFACGSGDTAGLLLGLVAVEELSHALIGAEVDGIFEVHEAVRADDSMLSRDDILAEPKFLLALAALEACFILVAVGHHVLVPPLFIGE